MGAGRAPGVEAGRGARGAKRPVAARRARGASSGGAHLQQAAHAARAPEAAQRLNGSWVVLRLSRSLLGQLRRRAARGQARRRVAARQRRLARHRQPGVVMDDRRGRFDRRRAAPLQRQRAGQLRREATSCSVVLSGRGSAARVSASRRWPKKVTLLSPEAVSSRAAARRPHLLRRVHPEGAVRPRAHEQRRQRRSSGCSHGKRPPGPRQRQPALPPRVNAAPPALRLWRARHRARPAPRRGS